MTCKRDDIIFYLQPVVDKFRLFCMLFIFLREKRLGVNKWTAGGVQAVEMCSGMSPANPWSPHHQFRNIHSSLLWILPLSSDRSRTFPIPSLYLAGVRSGLNPSFAHTPRLFDKQTDNNLMACMLCMCHSPTGHLEIMGTWETCLPCLPPACTTPFTLLPCCCIFVSCVSSSLHLEWSLCSNTLRAAMHGHGTQVGGRVLAACGRGGRAGSLFLSSYKSHRELLYFPNLLLQAGGSCLSRWFFGRHGLMDPGAWHSQLQASCSLPQEGGGGFLKKLSCLHSSHEGKRQKLWQNFLTSLLSQGGHYLTFLHF